jgi:hypothetical protein
MQLYRSACLSKNTVLLIGIELLGLTGVVSREGPKRSNQIVIDTVAKIREHFGDDALLCRYRFDRLFLVTTQIESREAQKKISRLEDELPSALALASPSAIIGFQARVYDRNSPASPLRAEILRPCCMNSRSNSLDADSGSEPQYGQVTNN